MPAAVTHDETRRNRDAAYGYTLIHVMLVVSGASYVGTPIPKGPPSTLRAFGFSKAL